MFRRRRPEVKAHLSASAGTGRVKGRRKEKRGESYLSRGSCGVEADLPKLQKREEKKTFGAPRP